MAKRVGKRTVEFENVYLLSSAAIGGKKEGEGPLGDWFDKINYDEYMGTTSFEKAESMLQKEALELAIKKAQLKNEDIDYVFAGDLLNQCIGSSFGIRDMGLPFLGLYGACSTMALSIGLASVFIDSGAANKAAAVTSSHFCSSERQFRFPLEYGSQLTPTAQWTTTASGAVILTNEKCGIEIKHFTAGEIVDLGVKDANNMGAAMAPAACSTILNFLKDTNTKPTDYDKIFTGDLGFVGSQLMYKLMKENGVDIEKKHEDCGKLMFYRKEQDVHSGASGCGCVGSTLAGYIVKNMLDGELERVVVCGTGALLSTVSTGQGESIPSIAHAIELKKVTKSEIPNTQN